MEGPWAIWQRDSGTSHPEGFPQSPSCSDWCLKDPAVPQGDKTVLGFLCSIGFLAGKQANPTPAPGMGAWFNPQGFELNVKGGAGKYRFGGPVPQLMSSEVEKLALV